MQTLHIRLKTITKPLHDEIEQNQYAKLLMGEHPTIAQYGGFLQKMLSFLEPIEAAVCDREEWKSAGFSDICIRKAENIKADIKYLGVSNTQSVFATILPNLNTTFAYSLGIWYVLEGSMVGASMQAPIYKKQFSLDEQNGLKYMLSYGDNAIAVFRAFMSHLEKTIITAEDEKECILGACDCFLALRVWLDK